MPSSRPCLLTTGEVLWDFLPSGKAAGGSAMNVAWYANQLGVESRVASAVGSDEQGAELLAAIDAMGIDRSLVTVDPGANTGLAETTIDGSGLVFRRVPPGSALDAYTPDEDCLAAAAAADAFFFGTFLQRAARGRETVQTLLSRTRRDCLRVMDVDLRSGSPNREILDAGFAAVSVVKMSDSDLAAVAELFEFPAGQRFAMEALLAAYPNLKHVVATMGPIGLAWMSRKAYRERPIAKTRVVDSAWSRDSLSAAIIAGLLANMKIGAIMDATIEIAMFVCAQQGSTPILSESLRAPFIPRPLC